jgi:hypothetical protein
MMNWKGFVRKQVWPIAVLSRYLPERLRKNKKTSVRLLDGPVETGTALLSNSSLQRYQYTNMFGVRSSWLHEREYYLHCGISHLASF